MQGNPAPGAGVWHCEDTLGQKGQTEIPDPYIMPSSGRDFENSSLAVEGGFGKTSACKTRPHSGLDTFNISAMESRLVQSQICTPDE